jgi:O-antigen ligase
VTVGRSAIFFGVVVTLAACAIDPAVHLPYLTPKRYAVLLAAGGALLLWAMRAAKAPDGSLRLTGIEATLAAAILWGVITNPHGATTQVASWFWLPLAGFLLTLVVRQLFNPPAPDAGVSGVPPRVVAIADLMTALWIVGSALAAHGLVEALGAGGFRSGNADVKTSVTSLIGTPNGFGSFMAAGIIAALASAAEARRSWLRLLCAGAALVQLAALVGNGSRGAVLGLVTAGLLVSWLRSWRGGPRAVLGGLAVLLAVALAAFLLHRLNPASTRGRLIAWEVSGAMLADRPLTGIGAGRFAAEWGPYQAELWRHPGFAEFGHQALARGQPNSELVHRLAEQGLPGGALYVLLWVFALGFLVRALRRQERTAAVDSGLLALLVAILVHSLVDGALRWTPTLVTVHLAFGLVPAPALLEADLRRRWLRRPLLLVAMGWAATFALKTAREYPGYRLWAQASRAGGAERLDLLVRAGRLLPSEPGLSHELGIALLEAGRLDEAAGVLERGLDAWDNTVARLALAEAQLGLGWLEPAEVNARRAAAEYPDRLAPRLLLARIHHARGEDAQARANLGSSIRRDTRFRSAAVDSLAAGATQLWHDWYDDEPPR